LSIRELTPLRILSNPVVQTGPDSRASVTIYRPFFLAGILSVLTAGCTLGAIALLGIALKGSYTVDVWTPYVLAHANSQLYGWVGFFIIGFALQQHAPSQAKVKLFHKLAYWSLGLMAVGIGLRFAAEPLVKVHASFWLPIGVFSCLLQFIAVVLFIANTQLTRHRTGAPLTWQGRFVLTSLAWMILVAAAEPFYFAYSHQPGSTGIMFVAEYFPPYREAQFLGFVAMMIFGVALTKMNSCFGAKPANKELALTALIVWNLGLLGRMVGWVMYFRSEMTPDADRLYVMGGILLSVAAVMLVFASRMFETLSEKLPSHKFIRAAFCWLIAAGVLMLLEPLHLRLTSQAFSHPYIGAIRHAVTVGFISQMILGVGMHVVAKMNDLPESAQKSLWSVFILINLGNTARVLLEIVTDYKTAAFIPMGLTGFVELTGLAIWAWHVARPMVIRKKLVLS
jgi:hypothetical protein